MGGLGWHEASPCLVIIREKGALWGSMRDWLERWLLSASDGMLHHICTAASRAVCQHSPMLTPHAAAQ
eukprot:3455186-Rhodomonas_salina.1